METGAVQIQYHAHDSQETARLEEAVNGLPVVISFGDIKKGNIGRLLGPKLIAWSDLSGEVSLRPFGCIITKVELEESHRDQIPTLTPKIFEGGVIHFNGILYHFSNSPLTYADYEGQDY